MNPHNRLAIIGAGSSGLVTLHHARQQLKGWEIHCYEKSGSIRGCWGNQPDGFLSTSTKYTTQFSCFRKYDLDGRADLGKKHFFQGGEFGDYLEDFADAKELREMIHLNTCVQKIRREENAWILTLQPPGETLAKETFSHLIIATGLVEQSREPGIEASTPKSAQDLEGLCHQRVVVLGGGESAADVANRLADPARCNKVALSLRHGIRVSPRLHPIKGVPSDFLRNRLMLSIRRDWRNAIGRRFVETRIRFREVLERCFPGKQNQGKGDAQTNRRKKDWDLRLTRASKDGLFNVFHNKSDGFLDAVGEERIQIIGPPVDGKCREFYSFDRETIFEMAPDVVVPMTGYQSRIDQLFADSIEVADFHLGCLHRRHTNLFLVGFARPIIGNIPSISEMQARFIMAIIRGTIQPASLTEAEYLKERQRLERTYPKLNTTAMFPVEMMPYCDDLARRMGTFPSRNRVRSWKRWLKIQLSPATTFHYLDEDYDPALIDASRVHMPPVLAAVLGVIRFCDWFTARDKTAPEPKSRGG